MSLIARLRARRHEPAAVATQIPPFVRRTSADAVRRLLDEPEWEPSPVELEPFHDDIRKDIKRRLAERAARDGAA